MSKNQDSLRNKLQRGVEALQLSLDVVRQDKLLQYLELLAQWNKVYNLTAVRSLDEMLTHHVLDSLSIIAPLLRYSKGRPLQMLDVGSGGGLPGVVIAICCPEIYVRCVDAVAKKTAFIQQAAAMLVLPNLQAQHARIENISAPHDVIVSRAFASLADFTKWSAAALAPNGVWLAMKGKYPSDEIADLPASVKVFHVEELKVPQLQAERCLIWMCPESVEKNMS